MEIWKLALIMDKQQKIQKEMEQMRKEIIEEKEQLYKDFPSEMEWEQRIDEMVNESLKNLFGGC